MVRDEFIGIEAKDIPDLRKKYGYNEIEIEKKDGIIVKVLKVLKEPMFLLLILTSSVYFFLGEFFDGSLMLVFVVAILGVEVYQEWKTDKTLESLKKMAAPKISVFRDNIEMEIPSRELIPGDVMIIHEGVQIPADGRILECHDLYVNESMLTG